VFEWDVPVGAAVELGSAIIDVEAVDATFSDGKGGGFATDGGPGDDDRARLHP